VDQITSKPTKRRATVIALSRHRSIVEAYERTIAQARRRAVEAADNFNAQRRSWIVENEKLATRNVQLVDRLETAEERRGNAFLWFFAGVMSSVIGLVCLSFAVGA
jgi:hypothetical protein